MAKKGNKEDPDSSLIVRRVTVLSMSTLTAGVALFIWLVITKHNDAGSFAPVYTLFGITGGGVSGLLGISHTQRTMDQVSIKQPANDPVPVEETKKP